MRPLMVRPYQPGDLEELAQLFHRAVRDGAAGHYSDDQRAAWSPAPPAGDAWRRRVAEADTVVAEHAGTILGFMTLDLARGYLDFAYVAPEAMGQGVSDALYAVLESRARGSGLDRLATDASELARSFFARNGWQMVVRQEIERAGITLQNYRMVKQLRQHIPA